MKVKLYDNENYEYPILIIKDNGIEQLKADLKEYQKNDDYNIDDFLGIIESKGYFIDSFYLDCDEEIYF